MLKNIIFDVGDVLLEYRWKEMLMDHGLDGETAEKVGEAMFTNPLWRELDYANIPTEEVILQYQKQHPEYADVIAWFITHGEHMHVGRPEVWKLVHQLKEAGYQLYILSNYSEDLFKKHTKGASFIEDMDGMVVSYMIHKIKPDPSIYHYLLDTYQLKPEECIFFDDREENTKTARELGIKAVTITSEDIVIAEINKILNNHLQYQKVLGQC